MKSYAERLVPFLPFSCVGMDDLHRFWTKFDRKGEDDCWFWMAGCYSNPDTGERNYGQFKLFGQAYAAHRVAYFFHHKQDPGKLLVCHTCNNRLCVNPKHLILGSFEENMQYAFDCGRKCHKGQFHPQANFNDSEIKMIRESKERTTDLAKRLGVSTGRISDIRNGRTYNG